LRIGVAATDNEQVLRAIARRDCGGDEARTHGDAVFFAHEIGLVAVRTGRTGRAFGALCALLALNALRALQALNALWTFRAGGTGITFWTSFAGGTWWANTGGTHRTRWACGT
jgi:hypothetical protein